VSSFYKNSLAQSALKVAIPNTITSKIFKQKQQIKVYLPENYENNVAYYHQQPAGWYLHPAGLKPKR
jgi:mannose/fructose/N-acetylgalactosamine-specific phosphotransferase system component IIB